MATYLLLRNNKESGPYSLEGLIQLGLKPYDLVWVEGRSAAWRYPSEVDDLKFYAPVVEEQPYDRFYKKPAGENKEKEIQEEAFQQVKQQVVRETARVNIPETAKEETAEIQLPRKQVFVSMPANSGKTVIIKKTEEPKLAVAAKTIAEEYSNNEDSQKKAGPVADAAAPTYSELVSDYNNQYAGGKKITAIKNNPSDTQGSVPVETKYSQSLDDIKDMYVQTLADRKRKNAQQKMLARMVKRVLPFAAVLIAGILVGVFIVNKKAGPDSLSNSGTQLPPKETVIAKPEQDASTTSNTVQQSPAVSTEQQPVVAIADDKVPVKKPETISKSPSPKEETTGNTHTETGSPVTARKNSVKENKAVPAPNGPVAARSIETDPATGERNKVIRSTVDEQKSVVTAPVKQLPATAWKLVSVKSNEYKRGTFGGIHDLQVTVTNNSNFLLDNVLVELQYLKPGDQPLKTDNIRFSPVPPNGSLTLAIPPTNRGVKVSCKIIHVESKAAANDTAGL